MSQARALFQGGVLPGVVMMTVGLLLARPQESPPPSGARISVDVEVVKVFATVRDKKGKIVRDLPREDFTLSEDGRAQDIQYFSRESDLPLTVGLLVDTTPSEANMLEEERAASRVFLSRVLRPDKDQAFLIQYSHEVELLQDLTSSPGKLEAALNLLERHELGGPSGGPGGGPGRAGGGAYATVLADAVYLASEEVMKPLQGRKALIILGDGDHLGDREEMAVSAAHQADTLIYTIRICDPNFGADGGGWRNVIPFPQPGGAGGPGGGPGGSPGGGPGGSPPGGSPGGGPGGGPGRSDGKGNLQRLSRRTGGSFFEAGKKGTLEQIYGQIEEELRSQYCLGYTPAAGARKGYRTIQLAVRRKDLAVHVREGYYPKATR